MSGCVGNVTPIGKREVSGKPGGVCVFESCELTTSWGFLLFLPLLPLSFWLYQLGNL